MPWTQRTRDAANNRILRSRATQLPRVVSACAAIVRVPTIMMLLERTPTWAQTRSPELSTGPFCAGVR
eukprot:9399277-Alexandrium_andersonii.AAC.1